MAKSNIPQNFICNNNGVNKIFVEVKNAHKSYGKDKILDNLCMRVEKGTM